MALHITILEGEDSLNSIRERTAREPIVQVEDENHKPVAGALVLFSIQNGSSGAGGSFNGLSSLSVTTDSAGRATAHGLLPNTTTGSFTITVTATLGALVATAIVAQSNVASLASASAASSTSAAGTTATRRIFRFSHIPKKVWITGTAVVTHRSCGRCRRSDARQLVDHGHTRHRNCWTPRSLRPRNPALSRRQFKLSRPEDSLSFRDLFSTCKLATASFKGIA